MPRPRFRAPFSRLPFTRHPVRVLARYARIRAEGLASLAGVFAARGYRRARSRPVVLLAGATALVLVVSLVVIGTLPNRRPGADQAARGSGATSQAGATPANAAAAKPKVGELPERSTTTSTTRRNKDGSYTTVVYSGAVNYRARDGSMRRIDSNLYRIKEGGYSWRSGANSFEARFKDAAGPGFNEMRIGNRTFRISAVGATATKAAVKGPQITYPGAYPSADLVYTVTSTGVKEVIELAGPEAATSYTFRLVPDSKGPAPSVQRRPNGSYAVRVAGLSGPAFVVDAPVVQESAPEHQVSPPARDARPALRVTKSGRDLVMTLSLDPGWLRASGRRFPVQLDPSMTIQPGTEDVTFITPTSYLPFTTERLWIGSDNNHLRPALQFDVSTLPTDARVTDAKLGLYFDTCMALTGVPYCGGVEHVMDVHRMTAPWSASSSQFTMDPTIIGTYTLTTSYQTGWMTWPVTGVVSNWVAGSEPNYGLMVKRHTEIVNSSGPAPPGRRFSSIPERQPKLEVTYTSDAVDLLVPETLHGNGADLAWTRYTGPSGAPFTKYEVHRAPGKSVFTPSASTLLTTITNVATTTYRDTTAAPDRDFTYRVVANGSASNPRTVRLPLAGQASKVLQPDPAAGRNTFLFYDAGSVNCMGYGTGENAWTGTTATRKYRTVLYFDLRDIPAGATISSATASVWKSFGPSLPMTVQAHRITRPWKEGTTTSGCSDGATWYNAESGQQWSAPGGDYDPGIAAKVDVTAGAAAGFHNFSITNLVQSWVSGSAPNNGLLLRAADETLRDGTDLIYYTDDYTASSTLRPKLAVAYADGSVAQGPVVSLAAPGPGGTVSGNSVRLAASAQDDRRVDLVEFLVDGSVVGTDTAAPYEMIWNSASVANGTRSVTVRATDDAGNVTTSPAVSVTVENTAPPTGSVSAPGSGSGVITLSATASDDVGVTQVEFLVDGVRVGAPDTSFPYSIGWNTLDLLAPSYNGDHAVTAVVTDTSGQQYVTAGRTVTVNNLGTSTLNVGYALNSPNDPADDAFPPAMVENTGAGVPVQDPYAGTARADGTSGGSLNRALGDAPSNDAGTPPASCPANAYCPTVQVTNNSGTTWTDSTAQVWYRWYAANGAVMFEGRSSAMFPSNFRKGNTAAFPLTIYRRRCRPASRRGPTGYASTCGTRRRRPGCRARATPRSTTPCWWRRAWPPSWVWSGTTSTTRRPRAPACPP